MMFSGNICFSPRIFKENQTSNTNSIVEGGKHVEHVEDAVKFKPFNSSTELIDGDDGQYAYGISLRFAVQHVQLEL